MDFKEYRNALARGQEVLTANRVALKKLLESGNMRTLSVLALVSEPIENFASAGGELLRALIEVPKSVLDDIEAAFGEGSTETPSEPVEKKKQRGKKSETTASAAASGSVRGEVEKLLDKGLTTDQVFEKLSGSGVTRATIAAIKAHRTRKKNGQGKAAAAKTSAKKPVSKKKGKKKKPQLSEGDKEKLYDDIRTTIALLGFNRKKKLDVAAVKEYLASSEGGYQKVDGRVINGVRQRGVSKKKKK